jgi:hypothetical protein
MADNLFRVTLDDKKYTDVCQYVRPKKNNKQTNADEKRGVKEAFAGLQCRGDRVNEWNAESAKEDYRRTFKRAKECMQRRISTMKRFPARNAKGKQARIRHIYPIELAYSYGKDCLKKFATKRQQDIFRNSTDALIDEITTNERANAKNVKSYFAPSIENSIRARGTNAVGILDRQYDYAPGNWNLINTVREAGNAWPSLPDETRVMYLSRFYDTLANRHPEVLEAVENEEENNRGAAAAVETPKTRLKRLKRRSRRAIPAPMPPPQINTVFLNALQRDPEFRARTEAEKAAFVQATESRLIGMQKNIEKLMLKLDTLVKYTNSVNVMTPLNKFIVEGRSKELTREERQALASYNEVRDLVTRALAQIDVIDKRYQRDYNALQREIARYPELGPWFDVDIYNYLIYGLQTEILALPNAEYYPLFDRATATNQILNEMDTLTGIIDKNTIPKQKQIVLMLIEREKEELKTAKNKNKKDAIQTKLTKYESQLADINTKLSELYAQFIRRNELFKNIFNDYDTLFDNNILLLEYEIKRKKEANDETKRFLANMLGEGGIPGGILNR